MALTVLIGGARSDKSALAVEWGRRLGGRVPYVEMAERVGRHRAERPTEWTTVEETVELRAPWDLPADPEMR